METSALEIKHIIAVRRLSYLQTILKRQEEEIVFQIYTAQKKYPCKGDWVLLVKEDQTKYGVDISDDTSKSMSKLEYSKFINKNVRKYALNEVKTIQNEHIKVKHILYESLSEPQDYLKDRNFNNRLSSL